MENKDVKNIEKLSYEIIANSLQGGLTYSYIFYRKKLDTKDFDKLNEKLSALHKAASEWLLLVQELSKNGDLPSLPPTQT